MNKKEQTKLDNYKAQYGSLKQDLLSASKELSLLYKEKESVKNAIEKEKHVLSIKQDEISKEKKAIEKERTSLEKYSARISKEKDNVDLYKASINDKEKEIGKKKSEADSFVLRKESELSLLNKKQARIEKSIEELLLQDEKLRIVKTELKECLKEKRETMKQIEKAHKEYDSLIELKEKKKISIEKQLFKRDKLLKEREGELAPLKEYALQTKKDILIRYRVLKTYELRIFKMFKELGRPMPIVNISFKEVDEFIDKHK